MLAELRQDQKAALYQQQGVQAYIGYCCMPLGIVAALCSWNRVCRQLQPTVGSRLEALLSHPCLAGCLLRRLTSALHAAASYNSTSITAAWLVWTEHTAIAAQAVAAAAKLLFSRVVF
jgi:hypothetical protein